MKAIWIWAALTWLPMLLWGQSRDTLYFGGADGNAPVAKWIASHMAEVARDSGDLRYVYYYRMQQFPVRYQLLRRGWVQTGKVLRWEGTVQELSDGRVVHVQYKDGKPEGLHVRRSPVNVDSSWYVAGKLQRRVIRHLNGVLGSVTQYADGKPQGKVEVYDEQGRLMQRLTYADSLVAEVRYDTLGRELRVVPKDSLRMPEAFAQCLNCAAFQKRLVYPEFLMDEGSDGWVLVELLLDAQGQIAQHTILQATHAVLAAEVERKLGMLRFTPARLAQRPVAAWVRLPVRFWVTE